MATTERLVEEGEASGCPDCGGDVVAGEGELACGDCGLVVDEYRLDHGPPGRFAPSRHGPPRTTSRHDRGLGTASLGFTDVNGAPVDSVRLSRLRTQEQRAHYRSKREQNLAVACGEIRRLTGALGQGQTLTEQACSLVRSAQEADLFVGRSIDSLSAASVLAALRMNAQPFADRDLVPVANCDLDELRVAYKAMNRELELPTPPPTATSQIPRISAAADCPDRFEADALRMARELDESGELSGRRPSMVAATCLYLVARERGANWTGFGMSRFADAADCSEEGLRNIVKAIDALDD